MTDRGPIQLTGEPEYSERFQAIEDAIIDAVWGEGYGIVCNAREIIDTLPVMRAYRQAASTEDEELSCATVSGQIVIQFLHDPHLFDRLAALEPPGGGGGGSDD